MFLEDLNALPIADILHTVHSSIGNQVNLLFYQTFFAYPFSILFRLCAHTPLEFGTIS